MPDEAAFDLNKYRARWLELARDGYIRFVAPGDWRVTERGMSVLMACADKPQSKTQLTKPSLAHERMHAERSRQITHRDKL